jgi:hypothetical protein
MPVNRTFKKSLPRHNGGRCSPTPIVERRFEDALGIRLIHIERGTRPDVVARGRMLAASADYPPPHVVNAIAELIADHVHL